MSDHRVDHVRSNKHRIAISGFENADISQIEEILRRAASIYYLEPLFIHDTYFTSSLSLSEKNRRQRDASAILHSAKKTLDNLGLNHSFRPRLNLLVTSQDLFVENMNFVFGLASPQTGIGIVSTARLYHYEQERDAQSNRFPERILKEAAHEIGHLMGLSHCENKICLMSFSESLLRVDKKLPLICESCRIKLIGHSPCLTF